MGVLSVNCTTAFRPSWPHLAALWCCRYLAYAVSLLRDARPICTSCTFPRITSGFSDYLLPENAQIIANIDSSSVGTVRTLFFETHVSTTRTYVILVR